MKTLLKISLITAIALTINGCGSKNTNRTTNHRSEQVTEEPDQSVFRKAIIKEEPVISQDSNRREMNRKHERNTEGYAKEQARFAKVLSEASDEELFIVLNYAIANQYVPNRDINPFYSKGVMVGCWQRTLMVYDNLSGRKDLMKKIYPDLKVLDEYVNWGRHGEPYPNDKVAQTILNNVQQESRKMDDKLRSKYFGTPLMRY